MSKQTIGIIGSGSWATAIAKIVTDNGNSINWWVRKPEHINYFQKRHHNPQYLRNAYFDVSKIQFSEDVKKVVAASDIIVIAVPSIYVENSLLGVDANLLKGKKVISAVKGVMPKLNILLDQYLAEKFDFPLSDYFTLLGPSHAEEVAAEQLSYLTFSGINGESTNQIAAYFKNEYINTVVNDDIHGVQYASIVKNIFALGAGIAHGLEYGDNFLSVYIANAANEMRQLLKAIMIQNEQVSDKVNYSASVYLGDLLVTCYSLHSRNRTFGNMIGKGYSVRAAELEMNMVAEGYNACKCIVAINENLKAPIPIIQSIYKILWEGMEPEMAFKEIEQILI
jgi:glycerol-3-phosphate dehydrogenase (NAD(P)+)